MRYTSYLPSLIFFFFNDTATTEIYTLSLHDALPILPHVPRVQASHVVGNEECGGREPHVGKYWIDELGEGDRKSTRLNSSHSQISYAVFCLKKKKKLNINGRDLLLV